MLSEWADISHVFSEDASITALNATVVLWATAYGHGFRLPPLEAPIMITKKHGVFFLFFHCNDV